VIVSTDFVLLIEFTSPLSSETQVLIETSLEEPISRAFTSQTSRFGPFVVSNSTNLKVCKPRHAFKDCHLSFATMPPIAVSKRSFLQDDLTAELGGKGFLYGTIDPNR